MRKSTVALGSALVGVLLSVLVMSVSSQSSPAIEATSYGEDRALIEDLQARYLFSLDFGDPDLYVSTFTPDGVLDYGNGDVVGRDAIKEAISGMPGSAPPSPDLGNPAPGAGRHHISNIVLSVEGDRATGRAYWFQTQNTNPEREMEIGGFGHYEDELVKVNGEWFFSKRTIYNEGSAQWAASGGNPAW